MKVVPYLLSFLGAEKATGANLLEKFEKFDIMSFYSNLMIYNKRIILITLMVPVLYKLFKLWIELKNGRKIRLRFRNIEIETTQLSEKQFLKFFALFKDCIGKLENEPEESIKDNHFLQDN